MSLPSGPSNFAPRRFALTRCGALVCAASLLGCVGRPSFQADSARFADGSSALVVGSVGTTVTVYDAATLAPLWKRTYDVSRLRRGTGHHAYIDPYLSRTGAWVVAWSYAGGGVWLTERATGRDAWFEALPAGDKVNAVRITRCERFLVLMRSQSNHCHPEVRTIPDSVIRPIPDDAAAHALYTFLRWSPTTMSTCPVPHEGTWNHDWKKDAPAPSWFRRSSEFGDAYSTFLGDRCVFDVLTESGDVVMYRADTPDQGKVVTSIGRRERRSKNWFHEGSSVDWSRPAVFSSDGTRLLFWSSPDEVEVLSLPACPANQPTGHDPAQRPMLWLESGHLEASPSVATTKETRSEEQCRSDEAVAGRHSLLVLTPPLKTAQPPPCTSVLPAPRTGRSLSRIPIGL